MNDNDQRTMDDSGDPRDRRAEAIFAATLDVPTADRPAAVAAACGIDADLRRRVDVLADALARADRFLTDPTAGAPPAHLATAAVGERPGDTIGRYKLLEQIGEGGFGVVFTAEQQQPVRRLVALKVIKLGMDTREVVARFEAERQALALMDHPNIAKVFDAGSTATGRPYFVMELVRGSPITEYADKHKLTTADRVALATQVCRAVQHAHSKGVIHRDLKPGNVLVTTADDKPVPKVIDFGIAKATQTRLTERTLYTAHRQLIGTPQYMSPEQADNDGSDIDTRTDVYSLGVVLYELLVGVTPLDARQLRSAAFEAMRRMIRDDDLPRPSTRLQTMAADTVTSLATNRSTDAKRLGQAVRGELDWIVMRALEKDRTRRYDTAAALADDLNRYLVGEAVLAGPVSGAYRLKKLARRHRAALGVAVAVAACLLLGVAGTTWGMVRESRQRRVADARRAEADGERAEAQRQRDQARRERDRATAIGRFLTDDMLAKAAPESARDRTLSDTLVKALIEPAMATVDERFKDDPSVGAAVQQTIANTLIKLGRADLAVGQAERAYRTTRAALGDDQPDTAAALETYLEAMIESGHAAGAVEPAKHLVDVQRARFGPAGLPLIQALGTYGKALFETGQLPAAATAAGEAAVLARRAVGPDDPVALATADNYAAVELAAGQSAAGIDQLRDVWQRARRVRDDDDDYQVLQAADNYVDALVQADRMDEAEPIARAELDRDRRIFGDDNRATIRMAGDLGEILLARHRPDLAVAVAEPAFRAARRVYRTDDHLPRNLVHTYAMSLRLLHRPAEAVPVYALNRHLTELQDGGDAAEVIGATLTYAQALVEAGRFDQAVPLAADGWRRARRDPQFSTNPDLLGNALNLYAVALDRTGGHAELDRLTVEVRADPALQPLLPAIAAAVARPPTPAATPVVASGGGGVSSRPAP